MKLIILRHSETEENKKGVVQGQLPGILTEKGLTHAKRLANRFKKEKIDFIYSSDLKRAKDVAKIIAKFHPFTPLNFVEELREMNFGKFQGKSGLKFKNIFGHSPEQGGESIKQFYNRVRKFFKKIKQKHKYQTVMIIGHAGSNRALMCATKNLSLDEASKIITNPRYIVQGVVK